MLEDIFYPLLSTYQKLPAPIHRVSGKLFRSLPKSVRFGKQYELSRLEARAQIEANPEWLLSTQWKKLELVLYEAFNHVPYYRNLYKREGINFEDIKSFRELQQLPRISKTDIQSSPESFISERFAKQVVPMNSGGSTGKPLDFYLHKGVSRSKERAYFDEFMSWSGYDEKLTPLARLTGLKLPGDVITRYEPIRNTLYCSSYNLDRAGVEQITDRIRECNTRYLLGYCSTIYQYSQLLREHQIAPPNNIEAIFLSSEPLYNYMGELISDVFGCHLQNWYGHSERLILAPRMAPNNLFYIYPLYGYAEIVDESGAQVDVGEKGRIVATSMDSLAYPFIRYDTEDEATYGGVSQDGKFRGWKTLQQIEGRAIEYIFDSEGKKISITAIIYGQHLDAFRHIKRMQLNQSARGHLEVHVVPGPEFNDEDGDEIVMKLGHASNGKIITEIVLRDEIPIGANGKFKYLVQNLREDIQ